MFADSELPQLLAQHRPRVVQTGYPAWLRARAGEYVHRRRVQGAGFGALADELGVSRSTLAKWAGPEPEPEAEAGGFSALVVTPDPPRPLAAGPGGGADSPLQVVSPHGFSLRGLSLDQALRALAVLR